MHRIAVLAYDTVVAFELAAATRVFEIANSGAESTHYDIRVVGPSRPVTAITDVGPAFSVLPDQPLDWVAEADTVLVPAHGGILETIPDDVYDVLAAAGARGARIVAWCRGAFVLAASGVLDGRVATTHWYWADMLAERYPAIDVQRDKLFVNDAGVYTAAGGTAVLDMALHLVEEDHGAAVAATTARHLVAPARRDGGQAQHVRYDAQRHDNPLQDTLSWAEEHLHEEVVVADLARHANMTRRSFSRHFGAVVGTTPLDWLHRMRIRRARELLEDTTWSVARVARECGFGSEATFRHHFARVVAMPPGRYRQTFATTTSAALHADGPVHGSPQPRTPLPPTRRTPLHGCTDSV